MNRTAIARGPTRAPRCGPQGTVHSDGQQQRPMISIDVPEGPLMCDRHSAPGQVQGRSVANRVVQLPRPTVLSADSRPRGLLGAPRPSTIMQNMKKVALGVASLEKILEPISVCSRVESRGPGRSKREAAKGKNNWEAPHAEGNN